MNKCLNNCGKDVVGRSVYCGSACKVAYNRNRAKAINVTNVTETKSVTSAITMHERQCRANNEGRARKHTVNTGARKSFSELAEYESNRVSLPGDGDYVGVVTEEMLV